MQYRQSKSLITGIVNVDDGKIDHINVCIGSSKGEVKDMVKQKIVSALKAGHEVIWNKGMDSEVRMFRDVEYDDPIPEMSKYVTRFTQTFTKGEATRHHITKMINPLYVDNPECGFCYKKVIKVYNDHLENKEKTPVKVCANCRKTLKITHEFMSERKRS